MKGQNIYDGRWNKVRYGRVDSTDEITPSQDGRVCLTDEIPKYSNFLCFTVSVRTNKFALKQLDRYSPEQEEVFQKIKSLHDSGLGYRKIATKLNENGLTTHKGKKWGGNSVHMILKRHREREERLEFINREYEPEWGEMKVIWERNTDK